MSFGIRLFFRSVPSKEVERIEFAKALQMVRWVGGVCVGFGVRLFSRSIFSKRMRDD